MLKTFLINWWKMFLLLGSLALIAVVTVGVIVVVMYLMVKHHYIWGSVLALLLITVPAAILKTVNED